MKLRRIASTLAIASVGCTSPATIPPSSQAQSIGPATGSITLVNPGFESARPGILGAPEGWFAFQHAGPHSYTFTLDSESARSGSRSLRIENIGPEVYGAIVQRVPVAAYRGTTLRYSVWLKTRAVDGSGQGMGAMATMQPYAGSALVGGFDFADLRIVGTLDWTRREISLALPPNADNIEIGVKLAGPGTVWLDDAELAVVRAR